MTITFWALPVAAPAVAACATEAVPAEAATPRATMMLVAAAATR
jgi:hypothetical protein